MVDGLAESAGALTNNVGNTMSHGHCRKVVTRFLGLHRIAFRRLSAGVVTGESRRNGPVTTGVENDVLQGEVTWKTTARSGSSSNRRHADFILCKCSG